MKLKLFYPDYDCSILGIPNALLRHYGVKTDIAPLPLLEKALKHNHKNVILIILDGMGIDMLQHNLPFFSFLRRHIKKRISSVFPPTTTAATTTFYSGLPPVAHGWLGWSPYFKDLGLVVELFTNKNFYTGQDIPQNVTQKMSYTHIFEKIKNTNPTVQTTEVFPAFIRPGGVSSFDESCQRIKAQTKKPGSQFIIAYWTDPDSTSHKFGPYSPNIKQVLKNLNSKIKQLCAALDDSLVIITADHGHIQNKKDIFLNDYPDLMDCLAAPLSLDMRAQAIFLKPEKETTFLSLFNRYLAQDFMLIKSQTALNMNLFGVGPAHPYAKDFLGDYLLISTSEKSLAQRFPNDCHKYLPGAHSGLTNREMLVPLILIEKNPHF